LAAGRQRALEGRVGIFRRDAGDDEHCEIALGPRVYRVPTSEIE
jgi:hypothetical protein